MPCSVAERWGSLLTDRESARGLDMTHARRRTEWAAGRIVVKWLFLSQARSAAQARRVGARAWPPEPRIIGERELESFAPEHYRQLEVRRGEHGAPFLVETDGERTVGVAGTSVSIAHRDGWALAALGGDGEVGVDIEVVASRHPAFFEAVLSDRERQWMGGRSKRDLDCLGTLLWVLKEAFLKTGFSVARSVWEIGAIDLEIPIRAEAVLEQWPNAPATLDAPIRLVSLPMRSTINRAAVRQHVIHAAYGAFGDMIGAVVAVREPERSWPPPSDARRWSSTASVTSHSI